MEPEPIRVPQWGAGGAVSGVAWLGDDLVVVGGAELVAYEARTGQVRGRVEARSRLAPIAIAGTRVFAGKLVWDLATNRVSQAEETGQVVAPLGAGTISSSAQQILVVDASGTERRFPRGCIDIRGSRQPDRFWCREPGWAPQSAWTLRRAEDGAEIARVEHSQMPGALTPDGARFVTLLVQELVVLDAHTAEVQLHHPLERVNCSERGSLVLASDGRAAAVRCAGEPRVSVIDLRSNAELGAVPLAVDDELRAVSSGGRYVALDDQGATRVLRVTDGAETFRLSDGAPAVAFAPSGDRIALASADGLRIVAPDGALVARATVELGPAPRDFMDTTLLPGTHAAAASFTHSWLVVAPDSEPRGGAACGYVEHIGARRVVGTEGFSDLGAPCVPLPHPVAISADASWVVGGTPLARIGPDGARTVLASMRDRAHRGAISEDGARIALATGREVVAFDGATGARTGSARISGAEELRFSPDGRFVLWADAEWARRLLDARTLRTLWEPTPGDATASSRELVFSPDSQWLVQVDDGQEVTLVPTSSPRDVRRASIGVVYDPVVRISPDGARLTVFSWARRDHSRLQILALPSLEPILDVRATLVNPSPDARTVLYCERDRLWRLGVDEGARAELGPCRPPLQFTDDGRIAWHRLGAILRPADGATLDVVALHGRAGAALVLHDVRGRWEALGGPTDVAWTLLRRGASVIDAPLEPDGPSTPGLGAAFVQGGDP